MTWLRTDHNGVGVYTPCLPLNLEIETGLYLSFYEPVLSCIMFLYAIFLLYIKLFGVTYGSCLSIISCFHCPEPYEGWDTARVPKPKKVVYLGSHIPSL